MTFDGSWPEWSASFSVPDDVFGNAYNAVPDYRRAWCKTTIAQLHTMYGTPGMQWGRTDREWRQGFSSMRESRPVDWTVVLMDASYTSAPRMLAAVMMPLLAGVQHIAVVRTTDNCADWSQPVLAGLELAGIESVFAMPVADAERFVTDLAETGEGRVLLLGDVECELTTDVSCWCEPVMGSLVMLDPLPELDQDVIAWAHPDCELRLLPEEGLENGAKGASAVYCTPDLVDTVPDSVSLLLSPGQEGCWMWPDLTLDMFFTHRMALLSD